MWLAYELYYQKNETKNGLWEYPRKNCRSTVLIRTSSVFQTLRTKSKKCRRSLSLQRILHLLYLLLHSHVKFDHAMVITGHSHHAICDWSNLFRQVCMAVDQEEKLKCSVSHSIQIDEAYFSGKRKHNSGRFLTEDGLHHGESTARRDMEM